MNAPTPISVGRPGEIEAIRVNRNIFLVDDDLAVCKALSVFLMASGYSVKAYHSAETFLEEVECMVEGIMLLDIRMPGMSGLGLQAALKKRGIDLPIIFITGHGDVQMSVRAMKGGAIDFLEKPFSNENLLESIDAAFSRADDSKKQHQATTVIIERYASLTGREREVMRHIVAGMTSRDIAEQLGLSRRTIEVHRHSIRKKMGAESVPDLIRKYSTCQQAGLE
jgi:two-component system response regulator FixJ